MALVSLNAVRKSFGSRPVLDGLDFAIEPGARVGVVGANGSGKSTMLKLIAGLEEPDAGTSVRRRGIVVSSLPQHPLGDERNALETVRAARPDLDELDRELHRVAEQLAAPELAADLDRMSRVLRRQEELVERWEAAGGPSIDGRARAMLLDVGLEEADLTLPTSALSGGQRKLIALTACLAQDPDVLLEDEPDGRCEFRVADVILQSAHSHRQTSPNRQIEDLLRDLGHPLEDRAASRQDYARIERFLVSGPADLVPGLVKDLLRARLKNLRQHAARHQARFSAADARDIHRLIFVDE